MFNHLITVHVLRLFTSGRFEFVFNRSIVKLIYTHKINTQNGGLEYKELLIIKAVCIFDVVQ